MIYPISFSIPKEKLIKTKYLKTKILSNLIPGDISTYIYNSEESYYNEYKISYFAITKKKGGWDCMRHYEILANGCIPYFLEIEKCPINTMKLLPKQLFIESNELYDTVFKNKKLQDINQEDINKYENVRDKLFNYTKTYLTTDNMAKYLLKSININNIKKILFLSGDTNPDYLRCTILHGFKILLKDSCHDYPKIPHIYKSDKIDYKKLYGKGITYTNNLDQDNHNEKLNTNIIQDIKDMYYDIIIYGSYHRGMPFYDLVYQTYKPNKIILLCGEDIHCCNYHFFLQKGHHVFVREL